jgi:hypothetical protein
MLWKFGPQFGIIGRYGNFKSWELVGGLYVIGDIPLEGCEALVFSSKFPWDLTMMCYLVTDLKVMETMIMGRTSKAVSQNKSFLCVS